jgi:hypothetical protein
MDKTEENFREFNARIFIKGKCYTFDQIYTYDEPINDKIITSVIWHTYNYISGFFHKLFTIIMPFKIFSNQKNKKKAFLLFLSGFFLIVLIIFIWFFLFKIKKIN